MDKLILKDGSELNIESGATESCFAVVTEDLAVISDYVTVLTKENLSLAKVVNESGEILLTLKNKYFARFDGADVKGEDGKYIVCFRISDVYTFAERLAMLEAENAALKISQEIQDEAIVELADIIAE